MLCLEDYARGKKWLVESDSLTLAKPRGVALAESEARSIQGFLSFRTLGFVKWFKTTVAIFEEEGRLKFAVAGKVFDLMTGNAQTRQRTVFPFLTYFTLKQNGKVVFKCLYWFDERDDCWPENDIFSYIARAAKNEKEKIDCLQFWIEHKNPTAN